MFRLAVAVFGLLALACVAFGPWGQSQMFVPAVQPVQSGQRYAAPVMSAEYSQYVEYYPEPAPASSFDGMLGWALLGSVGTVALLAVSGKSPVVIGVAADSGTGKSTFMRRLTSIFGGECKLNDIGRETNTLVSDTTTVICLDDYHKWDRTGRKSNPEWPNGITALHEACQNWDKMAADVTDLKAGKTVSKPIYNHITGELDADEDVKPTPIVIFEGLHPMHDDRVNKALDLTVYLDITDEVKFAWKAQRDIAERGATMEEVQAAIDGRKPDFAAYVEPQKAKADIVIQVLLSDLIDDPSGKFLKVKLIQKKGLGVSPAYFMDEGSTIEWTPNPLKLTTSAPGVKIRNYDDEWFGSPVSVIEMDGEVSNLEELIYVEAQLVNAGTKYYGELTEQLVANEGAPGSFNGTGLFQTVCAFKIREAYDAMTAQKESGGAKVAA